MVARLGLRPTSLSGRTLLFPGHLVMLLDHVIVIQSGARATGRVPEAFESGAAVVSPRVHFGTFPDSLSDGSYYCRCFLLTFVVDTLPASMLHAKARILKLGERLRSCCRRVGCPHMLQNKIEFSIRGSQCRGRAPDWDGDRDGS